MTRVAVGPTQAPEWMRDAVRAGGCEVVDYGDAQGLVWGDPRGPDAFGEVLRTHPQFEWVQLPFAGIETFVPHLDNRRVCGRAAKACMPNPLPNCAWHFCSAVCAT